MKKTLLLFITACGSIFAFAQQGYQWTPGTSLNSTAAVAGSPSSYTLGTLGAGVSGVSNETLPFASCGAPIDVLTYPIDYGFTFSNSPAFISDNYSIELVVKLSLTEDATWRRLVGFFDFTDVNGDAGIYVSSGNELTFYAPSYGAPYVIDPPTTIAADTWYHFVFTRNNLTKTISIYINGTLMTGTFSDPDDLFMPQTAAPNTNTVSFLKDDVSPLVEESSGQIAKIGIFDFELQPFQVTQRLNTVCNADLVTLPVSLSKFVAAKSSRGVELKWTTVSELNSRGFEIQRNTSNGFVTIGFVSSNGNSSQTNEYSFTDASPLKGKNFYRLKQIDINNNSTYSSTRMIDMVKSKQDLQLYPNPSSKLITVTNITAGSRLSIFNSNGQPVINKTATSAQEDISIEKIPTGVYILQVTENDGTKRTSRFSKM